jgi:4-amino-4-deoxy-L-arabinose transferase-like glycosyltransferase
MLRRIPRPLAPLLAVAALLTVAWTFTLAPLQGPDEPAHFNYTQHLAETGHKPTVTTGTHPDSSQTLNALILFNLDQLAGVSNARPAWTRLEEQRFADEDAARGSKGEKDGAGPNPLAKNPPLYYALATIPYKIGSLGDFWTRLTVMRLFSGLLYLLTVVFVWLSASEVFTRTWPRVIATGCVALLPQLTAISGTINADNLLITVWAAFTFVALRIVRRGPGWRSVLALCALAGASLLTHGRGTAILPPLVVTLVIALVRARLSLSGVVRVLAPGVALLVVVAAVYKLLLAPSGGAYGGEVTLGPSAVLSPRGFLNAVWQFYLPKLPFMNARLGPDYGYRQMFIESFFGRFATLEVGYPGAIYTLIQAACAVGIAGLVAFVIGRWAAVRSRWPEVAVIVAIFVSMMALLHLASYRALVESHDPLITGRYLLPLVTVFGLTVAFVLSSLRPRLSVLLGTLTLSGLLVLNLAGLMLTFTRFYA